MVLEVASDIWGGCIHQFPQATGLSQSPVKSRERGFNSFETERGIHLITNDSEEMPVFVR